jgi:YHS domain-containing protein
MKKQILILITIFITTVTFAQKAGKGVDQYNSDKKVAIQGYDPVSYFKQNKAIKGKKELTTSYEGVIYYFSSVENKDAFLKSPSIYEPQYGGWCAYAMGATGDKVEINPETFKIFEGKLYLFYNAYFNNTLKTWNKDQLNLKKKADSNWLKISK